MAIEQAESNTERTYAKPRRNMKDSLILEGDKFLARQHGLIETVIGQLKNICQSSILDTQSGQLPRSSDSGASGVMSSILKTAFEYLNPTPCPR